MKREHSKKLLAGLGLLAGALILSGCTANFCSNKDKAEIAYPYEQGVTIYVDGKDNVPDVYRDTAFAFKPLVKAGFISDTDTDYDANGLWAYVPVDSSTGYFAAKKANYLSNTIIKTAKTGSSYQYNIPSQQFFIEIDQKLLLTVLAEAEPESGWDYSSITADQLNPFTYKDGYVDPSGYVEGGTEKAAGASKEDCIGNEKGIKANEGSLLRKHGYLKFFGSGDNKATLWSNYDAWVKELKKADVANDGIGYGDISNGTVAPENIGGIGAENCPSSDFLSYYKSSIKGKYNAIRACLTTTGGTFGHYGDSSNWSVEISAKSYGEAWKKGFLEGLIVWPVAALQEILSTSIDPSLSGLGQILALVIVTVIVRSIIIALTFRSTMAQQKMNALQPQLAKLQAKYPNSNTNKAEQAKLAQEQMALYKRNKVSPFSSLIVMVVQFPVFIAVWGALQSSAVLSSGNVLNLRLSDNINTVLFGVKAPGVWANATGWWTALVLFILMAASQFLAMKLPQWLNKKRTQNIARTSANPAQDKSNSTMKMVSWIMLAFTVIMGFMLPAAMGVYWLIGGVISICQTLITQTIMAKKMGKK